VHRNGALGEAPALVSGPTKRFGPQREQRQLPERDTVWIEMIRAGTTGKRERRVL